MTTKELTNPQLVTLAVAELGGQNNYIDREEVAIHVNVLAPGRFNWRRYPENIDLEAVSVALRDARKERYGGLLTSDNRKGWMLTPSGIKWLTELGVSDLNDIEQNKIRKNSILANQELEATRLKNTNAYKLFIKRKIRQISLQDFYEFARINEYFQQNMIKKRLIIIDNAVSGNDELCLLWAKLKEKFAEEIK